MHEVFRALLEDPCTWGSGLTLTASNSHSLSFIELRSGLAMCNGLLLELKLQTSEKVVQADFGIRPSMLKYQQKCEQPQQKLPRERANVESGKYQKKGRYEKDSSASAHI